MTNPFAPNATAPAPAAPAPAPTAPAPAPASNSPAAPAVDPQYAAWLASQQRQATAPAPTNDGGDPFSGPAPQRPRGPRLREMYGRLLLITPKLVETVPNRKSNVPGATQQRMTADVVVLDGGTIHYGGRPEATPPTQHTMTAEPPLRIKDMFISAVGLVSQCADALEKRRKGQPGMVLGRLGVGEAKDTDQNPPYLLSEFTPEDKTLAQQYLANIDPFA